MAFVALVARTLRVCEGTSVYVRMYVRRYFGIKSVTVDLLVEANATKKYIFSFVMIISRHGSIESLGRTALVLLGPFLWGRKDIRCVQRY